LRSGSRMRLGLARRTASSTSGPGRGPARASRRTSATPTPFCSVRSALHAIRARRLSCRLPIRLPCRPISSRSAGAWHRAHALVLLDRAGWHTTHKLKLPANLTLLHLPPRSPELNPTENVWQYLRQTWLSNRVFDSYAHICDACCEAWNKLTAEGGRIASIATREWAIIGQQS
jgi:hypothetical protein